MNLPDFLYAVNKSELDGPLIIQTKSPHYIGKVYLFDSGEKYATFVANYTGWHFEPVPGYNIGITLAGTITTRFKYDPAYKQFIKTIMWDMAQFYTREIISNKLGFFKKYRIAQKEENNV